MNQMNSRKKNQLKVQDVGKTTHRIRKIYETYLQSIKKHRKITTHNRLDLETLWFWPIMPKRFPDTGVKSRLETLLNLRTADNLWA
jgi:hypothetical protein